MNFFSSCGKHSGGSGVKAVLVTGGAGFIGSHTVDLLLTRGYRVRVLDSLQERVHPEGWPTYLPAAVARFQGDVTRRNDWLRALDGMDAVVHLAAYQDYMPDFSTFLQVNTFSTALLFELIVEKDLPIRKVVSASSQAVYGEGKFECSEHGICSPPFRPAEQLHLEHLVARFPRHRAETALPGSGDACPEFR